MEAFITIFLFALFVFIWAHLPNHDGDDRVEDEYMPARTRLP